jgi:hypothetical protein
VSLTVVQDTALRALARIRAEDKEVFASVKDVQRGSRSEPLRRTHFGRRRRENNHDLPRLTSTP